MPRGRSSASRCGGPHLAERGGALAQVHERHERAALEEAPVVGLPPVEVEAPEDAGPAAAEVRLDDGSSPVGQPFLTVELGQRPAVIGVGDEIHLAHA